MGISHGNIHCVHDCSTSYRTSFLLDPNTLQTSGHVTHTTWRLSSTSFLAYDDHYKIRIGYTEDLSSKIQYQ